MWSQNNYTITYDSNTADAGGAPTDSNTYHYGDTTTALQHGYMGKTGYSFDHWNTQANGGGTSYYEYGSINISGSITLYAIYTPNTYTIRYDSNTATGGSAPANASYVYNGSPVILETQTTLTKTGYVFGGWTDTASDPSRKLTQWYGQQVGSVIVYAIWVPETYTVTYNANGGTGTTTHVFQFGSATISGVVTDPTRTGYDFLGWSTDSSTVITSYNFTGPVTFYAVWLSSLTISGPDSVTTTEGFAVSTTAFTSTGGSGSKTFSITSDASGGHVTINSSTGILTADSSTPANTYVETVGVTDGRGVSITKTISVVVHHAISLTISAPPSSTYGTSKTFNVLTASDGTSPYTWKMDTNTSGLTINSSTGALTVASTVVPGTYNESVTVTDSFGSKASINVAFTVNDSMTVTGITNIITNKGRADSTAAVTVNYGTGTKAFTFSSNPLGSHATLNGSNGALSIDNSVDSGTYTEIISVADQAGSTKTFTITVTVHDAVGITGGSNIITTTGHAMTSSQFVITGGTQPETFTISANGSGATISNSGYVTVSSSRPSGDWYETITATDALGMTQTTSIHILINAAVAITPITGLKHTQGVSETFTAFTVSGGTNPLIYSITHTNAGFSIDATSGVITLGTNALAGTRSESVTATDCLGMADTKTVTFTIASPMSITQLPTFEMTQGHGAYTDTLTVSGGTTPFVFTANNLTAEITLNSTNGRISISGNVVAGTYLETVTVTDKSNATATTLVTIHVNNPLTITAGTNIVTTLTRPDTSTYFVSAGGYGAKTYSISPGGTGLSVNSNGQVVVTGSAIVQTTTETVTVQDAAGATASTSMTITVNAKPLMAGGADTTTTTGRAVNLVPFTASLGSAPLILTMSGTSSSYITFDSSTGIISVGSQTASGTYYESITVTDKYGFQDTKSVTITVNAAISITTTGNGATTDIYATTHGTAHTYDTLTASGGTGTKTFSITNNSGGTSINATTGQITIANTLAVNTYYETITATDSLGVTKTRTITVVVNNNIVIAGGSNVTTTNGVAKYSTAFTATLGTGSYRWSLSGNPDGVVIDTNTGVVYVDSSTVAGTYPITVIVTDSVTSQSTTTMTVYEAAAMVLSGGSNETTTSGIQETGTAISHTGGTGTVTFAMSDNRTGLTIDTATGVVKIGTNAAAASFWETITGTDSVGATATFAIYIIINAKMTISTGYGPSTTYTETFTAGTSTTGLVITHGGTTPLLAPATWTDSAVANDFLVISNSKLYIGRLRTDTTFTFPLDRQPTAFSFTVQTGSLIGQYGYITYATGESTTASLTAGTCTITGNGKRIASFTLKGSSGTYLWTMQNFNWTVTPARLVTTYGTAKTADTFTVTGGTSTKSYRLVNPDAGFSINSSTGAVTVANTVSVGTYLETVTVADAKGSETSTVLYVAVNPAPQFLFAIPIQVTSGLALSFNTSASYGTGPYTYSLSGNPSGLTLASTLTGILNISNNVSANTYSNIQLQVTDSLGSVATKTFSLVVNPVVSEANGSTSITTTYTRPDSSTAFTSAGGSFGRIFTIAPTNNGITVDSQTGIVYVDSTTVAGTYNETVTSTDFFNQTAQLPILITVNPSIQITNGPSGATGSLSFSASGSPSSVPAGKFTNALGNFTVSWWQNLNNTNVTTKREWSFGSWPSSNLGVSEEANGFWLWCSVCGNNAGQTGAVHTASALPLDVSGIATGLVNSWHHLEIDRTGTTAYVYADGVLWATYALASSGTIDLSTQALYIGGDGNGSVMDGYITDFQIKNVATHTGSNFAKPTAPAVSDANTLILLNAADTTTAFADSGPAALTVTPNNGLFSSKSPFAAGSGLLIETTKTFPKSSVALGTSGGTGTVVKSMSPNIPGITFDTSTGIVTVDGTVDTGTYYETITGTDIYGLTGSKIFKIVVNPRVGITGGSGITTTFGTKLSTAAFTGVYGTGVDTWTVSGTNSHFTINSTSGVLTADSSTPVGTYIETVTVHDTVGDHFDTTTTIVVNDTITVTGGNSSLVTTRGLAIYSQPFIASRGTGSLTFTIVGNHTPTTGSITVGASNGIVTVDTATEAWSGIYIETVTATDGVGSKTNFVLTVKVNKEVAVFGVDTMTTTFGRGWNTLNETTTGYTGNYGTDTKTLSMYPLTNAGITFDTTTGIIYIDSATAANTYYETITATDTLGQIGIKVVKILVNPHMTITGGSNLYTTIGYAQTTSQFSANLGTYNKTWTLASANGQEAHFSINTIDTHTITITADSTTPVDTNDTITITATDRRGDTITATFYVRINKAVVMAGGSGVTTTYGCADTSTQFTSSLGSSAKTWSILPTIDGITIDQSGYVHVAANTEPGTYVETVTATDTVTAHADTLTTIVVNPYISIYGSKTAGGNIGSIALGGNNSVSYSTSGQIYDLSFWIYPSKNLAKFGSTSGNSRILTLGTSNIFMDSVGALTITNLGTQYKYGSLALNSWNHIRLAILNANSQNLYVNGVNIVNVGNIFTNTSNPNLVLGSSGGMQSFAGYITDLKTYKSANVLCSGGSTCPVPTSPVSSDANTGLLLNSPFPNAPLYDSGPSHYAATNSGATFGAVTPYTSTAIQAISTTVGIPLTSETYTATGGTGTLTYFLSDSITGISINSTTGAISVTGGLTAQTYYETITSTDSLGVKGYKPVYIIVNPTIQVTDNNTKVNGYSLVTTQGQGRVMAQYTFTGGSSNNGASGLQTSNVASGGSAPVTFALSDTYTGITIDPLTGIITVDSGTAATDSTTPRTYFETMTVTDAVGATGQIALKILINPAVRITGGSNIVTTYKRADSSTAFAVLHDSDGIGYTGTGPYTYSISPGTGGIRVDSSTGIVYVADTTTPGVYPETVTVTDSKGSTSTANMTVTVNKSVVVLGATNRVTTYSIPDTMTGTYADSGTVNALTFSRAYIYSIQGDPGITIDSSTGVVSIAAGVGNASTVTYITETITAMDALGSTGFETFTVRINPSIVITGTSTMVTTTGIPRSYQETTTATTGTTVYTGGSGTVSFALTGTYPSYFSIGTKSGLFSIDTNTPAGQYYDTITVTDSLGATSTFALDILVNAAPVIGVGSNIITTFARPDSATGFTATLGTATNVSGSRGTSAYVYTIARNGGTQPSGITINSATGVVSADATVPAGVYYETVTVTDSMTAKSWDTMTITVNQSVTVTGGSNITSTYGVSRSSDTFTANYGTGNKTFSIGPDTNSVSIDPTSGIVTYNGVLTSNSTTAKVYTETITATDSLGMTGKITMTITVNPAIVVGGGSGITTTDGFSRSSTAFTYTYGTGVKTFSLRPDIPSWITIDSTTGIIKVDTTTTLNNTLYDAYETVTVTDSVGGKGTALSHIIVNKPVTIDGGSNVTTTFARADTSTVFSGHFGTTPLTFSETSTPSAAGITIDQNGYLHVSNTVSNDTYTVWVTVTDSVGSKATKSVTVLVNAAIVVGAGGNIVTTQGILETTTAFTKTNGTGTLTFGLTDTITGITIDSNGVVTADATLTSTNATTTRVYYDTVTATDTLGVKGYKAFTVMVNPKVTVTGGSNIVTTAGVRKYSAVFVASYGTTSGGVYTYTISGNHTGISLSSGGIVTVDTNTPVGNWTETVTAMDQVGAIGTETITIRVNPTLVISGGSGVRTTQYKLLYSSPFSYTGGTDTNTGGTIAVVYSIYSGGSTGISINSSTGVIKVDTNTAVGTYNVTVQVQDSASATDSKTVTITVYNSVSVTGATNIYTTYNIPATMNTTIASYGVDTKTFGITGQTGITIDTATGYVSVAAGTAVGTWVETITATDQVGMTGTETFTVKVNPTLSIGGTTQMVTTQGVARTYGSDTNTGGTTTNNIGSGGTAALVYALSDTYTGISINSATGAITIGSNAMATDTATARTYLETVTATDNVGATAKIYVTIVVNPPVVIGHGNNVITTKGRIDTSTGFAANYGTAGNATPNAVTSGARNYLYALSGDTTSALVFDTTTGNITTTATTAPGLYRETVSVTDSMTSTDTFSVTILVNPSVSVSGAVNLVTTYGVGLTMSSDTATGGTVLATGGNRNWTFSITGTAPSSNAAVTIDANTGVVTVAATGIGISNADTTYYETITATDALNMTGTQTFTIRVNQLMAFVGTTTMVTTSGIYRAYQETTTGGTSARSGGIGNIQFSIDSAVAGITIDTITGLLKIDSSTAAGTYLDTITTVDSMTTYLRTPITIYVNAKPVMSKGSDIYTTYKRAESSTAFVVDTTTGTTSYTHGTGAYKFSITRNGGSNPAGIAIDTVTGIVKVDTTTPNGIYYETVTATDSMSATVSLAETITVNDTVTVSGGNNVVTTWSIPQTTSAFVGAGGTIVGRGGTTGFVYSFAYSKTGLSINSSTGVVSIANNYGDSTTGSTYTETVTVTDNLGMTGTKTFTITVNKPIAISDTPTVNAPYETATTLTYAFTNGSAPINSVITGTIPSGFSWDTSTAGKAVLTIAAHTLPQTVIETITATDSVSATATKVVTITVLKGQRTATISPATLTIKYGDTVTVTTVDTATNTTGDGGTYATDGTLTYSIADTSTTCTIDPVTGVITADGGVGTCKIKSVRTAGTYYDSVTSNTLSVTIAKADTITVTLGALSVQSYTTTAGVISSTIIGQRSFSVSGLKNGDTYTASGITYNYVDSLTTCAMGGNCSVGQTGPGGGIVFYAAGSVQPWGQYLEAAPASWAISDTYTPAAWCNTSTLIDRMSSAIGDGLMNTNSLISKCASSAAATAHAYTGGNQSNWYLPSSLELAQMWTNRSYLGLITSGSALGYWASDETTTTNAQVLTTSGTISNAAKSDVTHYMIRPIRAFVPVTGTTSTPTTTVPSTAGFYQESATALVVTNTTNSRAQAAASATNYQAVIYVPAKMITTKINQDTFTLIDGAAGEVNKSFNLDYLKTGGSGGGAVTYKVVGGTAGGCSVAGNLLTATSTGVCYVSATKASDNNYYATTSLPVPVRIAFQVFTNPFVAQGVGSGNINITPGLNVQYDSGSAPSAASYPSMTGVTGASIVITGTGFTNVTAVRLSGAAVSSFHVDSDTQITFVPGAANGTGPLLVYLTFPGPGTRVRGTGGNTFVLLNPVISLSTSTLTGDSVTAVTSYTITNIGSAATSYTLSGPTLPAGITFDATTGIISGTISDPYASTFNGTYTITANNANSSGASSSAISVTLTLHITGAPSI
jgi:uncharacterized repeat protein (TIGR02543 family)